MEIIAKRVALGESITTDKKTVKGLSEAYGDRSKRDLVMNGRSRVSLNSAGSPLSPTNSIQPSFNISMPTHARSTDSMVTPIKADGIMDKPLPTAPADYPQSTYQPEVYSVTSLAR
jgi:hypothetical protein